MCLFNGSAMIQITIQIQHLLKLNRKILYKIRFTCFIQIQHLLKLNPETIKYNLTQT